MRRVFRWMMVAVLCCAASVAASAAPTDARLQEAQAAFDEAANLQKEGKYTEAIAKGEQALALREAVLGGSHPEVAACLNLLGNLYLQQGEPARAEPPLQRALAIREAALGEHHLSVADSLNSLAILYAEQGSYGQAEPLFRRTLAIREAALGKDHPNIAQALNNLANICRYQGIYDQAESLYQRALAIREAALGTQHPLVATSLNNLAVLYMDQGLHGRAEPLYQRALAIREAALGKHHPDVAGSLNNLADLYHDQGLHGRAEPLYQRALAIREAILGKHHRDVAFSLNNLANLYMDQGLYGRAEPLHQRALAIREATLGKHHPLVATSLTNLANLYRAQGLYGQAAPLHQRALAILEAVLGKHHADVAFSLNNLANLYMDQGLYDRAEPLHQRALAIREVALGKHHPLVATSLTNLANLYRAQGLYGQAAPLYQRALTIWEAAFGKHHPAVAETLKGLAQLHLAQRRLAPALPLLARAFTISEQRLRKEALDFSEARLADFLQFLRAEEELLYALLRTHPENARVRRLALSSVLLRKGRSVEETSNTSRTIIRSLGPSDRDTFERLRSLRTQLAQLSLEGPGPLSPADYQKRIKDLAEQGDALEADLARRSAPLRALAALPPPEEIVDRVAASLPKDGALVELVAYADRPLVPKPGTPVAQLSSQLRYLALVLFPDASIHVVDLGAAAAIDQAASALRNALAHRDAAFQGPAQALYTVAFKPLLPLLGSTRRLLLAPDGQLGLVPFSALHDGKSYLIDSFDMSYLTSGKDLLPRPEELPSSGSVVVLADPDFSAPAAPPTSQVEAPAGAMRSAALERFYSTLRADVAEQDWAPLPGTRQEAEAIHRLIPQAQLFLGPEASKQHLLQLAAPGVLHIATHGFFLEDAGAPTGSRGVAHLGSEGIPSQRPPDPLLRSGLVLSGAHAPISTAAQATGPRADGALVTALELAGLDLWGTQLVVLSACDTGRGDVKLGQGVYGLRRALVTAGAETVVMSLWKVNDETTRQLMEEYYRSLLKGQGRAAALRQAMLSLREKEPHPYAWAPFIALGRDAPLRPLTPLAQQPSPVAPDIIGLFSPMFE
jgi:CHAT domain-containing protein